MKILMSAYACEPGKGSEPGAGWAWARAAATEHHVWLLTRHNNRPSIESAMGREPHLRITPIYIDPPTALTRWKKGQRGVHLYYVLWQLKARRTAKELHQRVGFDVAHHITFAVDWLPAGVVGINGLPAVWGPVGGTAPWPWRFWRWLGVRGFAQETMRSVIVAAGRTIFGNRTARAAQVIVAQNHEVASRYASARTVTEPNVALAAPALCERTRNSSGNNTALYVGRLLPSKGILLAVKAISSPGAETWQLRVFGEGPALLKAQKLAIKLSIAERVTFEGQRPRNEVLDAYQSADALLFPSMHDAAGWAIAEAVLAGVPFVAIGLCGPKLLAQRTHAGLALPVTSDLPAQLAKALSRSRSFDQAGFCTSAITDERLPTMLNAWYTMAIS